jgi:hypothetical protein
MWLLAPPPPCAARAKKRRCHISVIEPFSGHMCYPEGVTPQYHRVQTPLDTLLSQLRGAYSNTFDSDLWRISITPPGAYKLPHYCAECAHKAMISEGKSFFKPLPYGRVPFDTPQVCADCGTPLRHSLTLVGVLSELERLSASHVSVHPADIVCALRLLNGAEAQWSSLPDYWDDLWAFCTQESIRWDRRTSLLRDLRLLWEARHATR